MNDSRVGDPTDDDRTMLRMVTAPDGDRQDLWNEWVERVDIDHLSPAAHGLLPALHRVVDQAGIDHPWVSRLRGIYRRDWTERQIRVSAHDAVTSGVRAAGFDHLGSSDLLISRHLVHPGDHRIALPRVTVTWSQAPDVVAALTNDGWTVDDDTPPQSARKRLTRTTWPISHRDGHRAQVVTFFNPLIVDGRRDRDVWERARSEDAPGPPDVGHDDLAVAAVTDQFGVDGAVRWALGSTAVLNTFGHGVDLRRVLDRPAARHVLPIVAQRLQFLAREGLVDHADQLLDQIRELQRRHPTPESPTQRVTDAMRRRFRAAARQPRALREVVARHHGIGGVVAQLRSR